MSPKKILAWLLFIAFAATVAYAFYFRVEPTVDADAYDAIATNLIAGNGYVENSSLPIVADSAIGRVGPGYEFFLAAVYIVFGHHFEVVWIIQAFLHVLTGWLIFLICTRLFAEKGEKIGLIAAALYIFFIDPLQMSAMLMTETLFLFLLTLSIFLFIRFYDEPSSPNALWLGIAAALAVLTRPTSLLALAIFVIFALSKKYFRQAIIIVACAVVLIAPWTYRNYLTYHKLILTTAAGGYDLWVGNNPQADGSLRPTEEITEYLKTEGIVATDERGMKETKTFVLQHPIQFLKLIAVKTAAYFSAVRPLAFWTYMTGVPQKIIMAWSAIGAFVLLIFGLAGAYLMSRSKNPKFNWFLLLFVCAPISVIPIIVESRYRLPVFSFLAIFSAYFISAWTAKFIDGKWKLAVPLTKVLSFSALIILLATSVDMIRNISIIVDRLGL